jgi:arylsulfatase A-like enzyme
VTEDSLRLVLARATGALGSGVLAGVVTGLVYGLRAPSGQRLALAWRLAGLLAVPGAIVGCAFLLVAVFASPARLARIREFILDHARPIAVVSVVVPPACTLWLGLAAFAGRHFLTAYHHVGLAAMAQAAALLVLALAVALPAVMLGFRLAPRFPERTETLRRALWIPLLVGVLASLAIFGHGFFWGDIHGQGNTVALFLGGFGVLKKPELDLTPVVMLWMILGLAAGMSVALRRRGLVVLPVAAFFLGLFLGGDANWFGASPVAAEIDARPGLARSVLRALRARYDRDHDGFAGRFGGGDCNDGDARVNPGAVDQPGNGVDEDCSGRDARRVVPFAVSAQPSVAVQRGLHDRTPDNMNLVLITVDTLRADLHFAGYPHPITPNLDRYANESVVFENAYALSSYTGRAIGPLLTGRYPTECPRDSEHFVKYLPSNVLLTERLRQSGFHTFGAASHFYFERHYGFSQGMEQWDMSARPSSSDQESTYNDHRVADRAIAMLRRPEYTSGRFFMWVHFLDPHKQYVDHPDLPLFGRGERARYDREVMFTDQQIGRVIEALGALPGDVAARTVVVVTADHGEAFGEHHMSYHGVELWQELVRVPWIMHVPGLEARRVTTPRSQIDLVPTLLDLLRVSKPEPTAPDALSGVSLTPDLLGESAPERPIYIELPEGPFNGNRRAAVYQGWKLIERSSNHFDLFDLTSDPGERHDLAHDNPQDLARMRAVMEQARSGLHLVTALPPREAPENRAGGGS